MNETAEFTPAPPRGRLVPNVIALLVAQAVSKSTSLVTIFLLAHYLGQVDFGRYAVALAIPMALEAVGDLGISQVIVRDAAGRLDVLQRDLAAVFPLKLGLAAFSVMGTYLIAITLGLEPAVVDTALFLGAAKALDSLTMLARSTFEAHERMDYEGVSLVFDALVRLAFVVYALASGFGLVGLAKALALASGVVLLATTIVALRLFLRVAASWVPHFRRGTDLLRAGLPFALTWFLEALALRFDVVLVGVVQGDAAAGLFAAAVRLIEPLLVVPSMMGVALLPLASRHLIEGRGTLPALFRASQKVALLGALATAVVMIAGAPLLMEVLYGAEFAEGTPVLRVLAIALVPLFLRPTLWSFFLALRRPAPLLAVQVAGLATNVAVSLALVGRWGPLGVAFAVLCGEAILLVAGRLLLTPLTGVPTRDIFRILAAGVPSFAVLATGLVIGPVLPMFLALVVLVAGVRGLRAFEEMEIRYIESAVPRLAALSRLLLSPVPAAQ